MSFAEIIRSICPKKNHKAQSVGIDPAVDEIWQAHQAVEVAFDHFNQAEDIEVIDATIYEIKATQKRMSFLLNEIRRRYFAQQGREADKPWKR